MVEKRGVGTSILLSVVTCGLYGMYWLIKLTDETNEVAREYDNTSGILSLVLSIVTFGIYGIYWAYQMGKKMDRIQRAKGVASEDKSILYLILSVFGLQLVNLAIIQSDLNSMLIRRNSIEGDNILD